MPQSTLGPGHSANKQIHPDITSSQTTRTEGKIKSAVTDYYRIEHENDLSYSQRFLGKAIPFFTKKNGRTVLLIFHFTMEWGLSDFQINRYFLADTVKIPSSI